MTDDTTNNDNAKPDGQAVSVTRDVMPMALRNAGKEIREYMKHASDAQLCANHHAVAEERL